LKKYRDFSGEFADILSSGNHLDSKIGGCTYQLKIYYANFFAATSNIVTAASDTSDLIEYLRPRRLTRDWPIQVRSATIKFNDGDRLLQKQMNLSVPKIRATVSRTVLLRKKIMNTESRSNFWLQMSAPFLGIAVSRKYQGP
jgi:hypothetical protein